jgi:hypothetical protein
VVRQLGKTSIFERGVRVGYLPGSRVQCRGVMSRLGAENLGVGRREALEVPVCRLRSGLEKALLEDPTFPRIFWKLVTHLKLNSLSVAKIAFPSLHGLFA